MRQEEHKPLFSVTTRTLSKRFAEPLFRTPEVSQEDLHRQDLHKVKDPSKDGIKHHSTKYRHFDSPSSADFIFNWQTFQLHVPSDHGLSNAPHGYSIDILFTTTD